MTTSTHAEHQAKAYMEALRDDRWQQLRRRIFLRDGRRCRHCGGQSGLAVHHRQYHILPSGDWQKPWCYAQHLLVTLCEACHKTGHQHHRIPVFQLPANTLQPGDAICTQ